MRTATVTRKARANGGDGTPQLPVPIVRKRGRPPLVRTPEVPAPVVRKGRDTRIKFPPMSTEEIEHATGRGAEVVRIHEPRLRTAVLTIRGISPYVQHAFSEKQRKRMEETQRQGQQARGKRVREPKDFNAAYESAKHVSRDGWLGIPAPAFRNAMISACRLVGFVMTRAKLSVFVEADGFDANDGTPLVRIYGSDQPPHVMGKTLDKRTTVKRAEQPHIHEASVRNESGVADIRWRPMWDEGWTAKVRVTWDEDQFSATDVMNLMLRAGLQVGIGEGRPDSPKSNGLGWGRFEVAD